VKNFLIAGSMLGVVAVGTQTDQIKGIVNPPQRIVGLEAQDTHAAVSLLGQFRTSLSSFLFLRADLYLHGGVEMRPLSEAEIKAGRIGVGGSASEKVKLHDDSKIVTVVPASSEDFRGVFGDVERAVASYRDMKGHHHQSPVQTLPLFRLMTWLDPQFIQGWTTGGQIIIWDRKPGSAAKSIEFLTQGLNQNPDSIDILAQIGYTYLREDHGKRDFAKAIPYLEKAKNVGVTNFKILSDQEKDALERSFRSLSICYRETSRYTEMKANAQLGLDIFGQDGSLRIHLEQAEKLLKGQPVEKVPMDEDESQDHEGHDHTGHDDHQDH
jgi:hypothetical protein